MSLAPGPSPSVTRGELTLQPNYFTSSLFVDPLREDIDVLISSFCATLKDVSPSASPSEGTSQTGSVTGERARPFEMFRRLWDEQGWRWLHYKTFDARTRRTFTNVVFRLFLEKISESEPVESRVASLFGLFMFYSTQPESAFPPLARVEYLGVQLDTYQALLKLPATVAGVLGLSLLAAYCSHIILALRPRLLILPQSELGPYVPRTLPRERFIPDTVDGLEGEESQDVPRKKLGRPTKKEALRRTRAAAASLGKWLDNTGVPDGPDAAHAMMSSVPSTLRTAYVNNKHALLEMLSDEQGQEALAKANRSMLARLRVIDERAAARGMEVGSEGGERTGMGRAERAVSELGHEELWQRGGLLGLMEGAGLSTAGQESPGLLQNPER